MFLTSILILLLIGSPFGPPAHAAGGIGVRDLMSCYRALGPYTTAGSHATVYPKDPSHAFIPGEYGGKTGLWVYTAQGAAFVAIAASLSGKAVAFAFRTEKGPETVIYQPASGDHGARVWLRPPGAKIGSGVRILFRSANDAGKRAPFEEELDKMVRGMLSTWNEREGRLVQAVNAGKYFWVDVDVDNYKKAADKCRRILDDVPETASLRASIQSEASALNRRANQTGAVRDYHPPSAFMTTPQY